MDHNHSPISPVERILELLGRKTLLLPWPLGSKGTSRQWGHLTSEVMSNPDYISELATGNIGVALGPVSDNLVSLDIDDDNELEEFITRNPEITNNTLRTSGRRGGNIWWRMKGDYPPTKYLKRNGRAFGEWRSARSQTIIYGKHPDGPEYRITNNSKPHTINFSEIKWPDGMEIPLLQQCTQTAQNSHSVVGSGEGVSSELSALCVSNVASVYIGGRIGIGREWDQIPNHVKKGYIRSEWEQIITEEVALMLIELDNESRTNVKP